MAQKITASIRRTGRSTSAIRQLVAVSPDGTETVLSTPIEKVSFGLAFRHGGRAVPVEQYAFKVLGKTYERFADAASIVLKRHHVTLEGDLSDHQEYVQRAIKILRGEEQLRLHTEVQVAKAA